MLSDIKMPSTGEIIFMTGSFMLVCVVIFWLYVALNFASNRKQRVVSRGANGFEGDTINLMCPSGKTISTFKAQFACDVTGMTGSALTSCDPFTQTGDFNASTTQDAKDWLSKQCDGKSECSVVVPSQSTIGVLCPNCPKVMLIGNYDCYP